ncbi:MAG: zf-TFIIB domain-containing protein [Pseudomonadota bacterium]
MQCPVDGTTLVMTDRSGVEIDYCPRCRGVWLDRGELDKIIEGSSSMPPPPPPGQGAQRYDEDTSQRPRRPKKRDGIGDLLGDIFDF